MNAALMQALGLTPRDRAVIFHTDDIGVTESSVAAARMLWQAGAVSSSAIMVPCAWFEHAAALARALPNGDFGVHVTLTCEWGGLRWGPISTRDPASGLLDAQGGFYRRSRDAAEHAQPAAAAIEIEAQIARALAAGIDVTHIDTHMESVVHPALLGAYLDAAVKYKVPATVRHMTVDDLTKRGFDVASAAAFAQRLQDLEAMGMPLMDSVTGMRLDRPERRVDQMIALFDSVPEGISHVVIHPSTDTPEAQAVFPDLPSRHGDLTAPLDPRVQAHLHNSGLRVVGYRALRDAMRALWP
jgi:chitin disaccharide deacetylase